MQKLLGKDKKRRRVIKLVENKRFILKSIFKNFNYFTLVRWNAFVKLKCLINKNSQISLTNRCLEGVNRKRLNKLTTFSRHIFLKLIRSGLIIGMRKAS
jgi:ribosomal protein S14